MRASIHMQAVGLAAPVLAFFVGFAPAGATCLAPIDCCLGDLEPTDCSQSCCFSSCGVQTASIGSCSDAGDNSCVDNTGGSSSTGQMKLSITDSELPSLGAELRTWQPPSNVPFRGVVLFVPGADGTHFLSDQGGGSAHCNGKMMQELAEIGFFVIDSRWPNNNGWKNTSFGLRREAARFATLVKFLHKRYFDCADFSVQPLWNGPFIVVGNSSGAAEVGYALTTYNLEPYIDLAILTSGPPEARLDQECGSATDNCSHDSTNVDWCDGLFCTTDYKTMNWIGGMDCDESAGELAEDLCNDNNCGAPPLPPCPPDSPMTRRPTCIFATGDPEYATTCTDDTACASYLRENSVLWGDATPSSYPRTTVHVILAVGDTTQAPTGALAFYDHLTSRKRLWYLSNNGITGQNFNHDWFTNASNGRQALKYAIEYFTRPFVGDVNFDGVVDALDYTQICVQVPACCAGGVCVLPENRTVCQPPNPDPSLQRRNFDVNNDGVVDINDVNIVGTARAFGCSQEPCQTSLLTCTSYARSKQLYPTPTASNACASSAPATCSEINNACAWCTQ